MVHAKRQAAFKALFFIVTGLHPAAFASNFLSSTSRHGSNSESLSELSGIEPFGMLVASESPAMEADGVGIVESPSFAFLQRRMSIKIDGGPPFAGGFCGDISKSCSAFVSSVNFIFFGEAKSSLSLSLRLGFRMVNTEAGENCSSFRLARALVSFQGAANN